ncbi:MAG: hypothetical protein K0U41_06790 [Gammaproteobacteria bacterium]|nr:hypothetical protein [Gammaproteobacteria bacterium]
MPIPEQLPLLDTDDVPQLLRQIVSTIQALPQKDADELLLIMQKHTDPVTTLYNQTTSAMTRAQALYLDGGEDGEIPF